MPGPSHLIVGDGITALAFLESCLTRDIVHVTVVGRTASQLGRGVAYARDAEDAPWRFAYLLNSPADDIDPAFAAWLAENWDRIEITMAGRKPDWLRAAAPLVAAGDVHGVNAPREFYGDFMELRAQQIIDQLRKAGIKVTLIDDIATSMRVEDHKVSIRTSGGQMLDAQSADVAPGGPETMRFEGDDGPFSAPSVFGYEHRISEHIKAGSEIFCIGGNAAMLDVLRLCQSHIPDSEIRFAFCAPEGEVPPPLVPTLPRRLAKPNLSPGHASAQSFLSEIRREIDAAEASGHERRDVRAGFRAHFLEHPLHLYVADPEEAAEVAKVLRFWLRGGTRDTIFDMRRLVDAGRVQIVKGHVRRIETTNTGATVVFDDEHGVTQRRETGFVVNCAGAAPHSRFDPLTEDLLRQGLIDRNRSGGLVIDAKCQTKAPNLRYLSPAVVQLGEEVVAMPLYDAHMLRTYVARAVS
ncbi:hypothetical protein So717_06720 [Roseobacter cerasinus]|uniref:FAD-dependent urate hydroxylase HpyO/Asp monooxygenase CreE-like FAD/NAD(P)-binding domain-containing protein n=1 Tax=Roseobacter cerasinus TaxID=2602289 RepID=A0A640VLG8_9RHOB|nr:FAD/NAD(P)-binding protein [Roseobacter cerasinus]GFE48919.1 hypothetical protein So717_06720 [Roseobacter cerasinus]